MDGSSHRIRNLISCATIKDIPSIVSCTNDAYIADAFFKKSSYVNRFTESNVFDLISAPNSAFLVSKSTDEKGWTVCGSIYILWEMVPSEDETTLHQIVGKFSAVAVHREHQRMGIGHSLVAAAEDYIRDIAKKKEVELCQLTGRKVNIGCAIKMGVINLREDLFPWYSKQGFSIVGEMPWDAELSRIVMTGYEHVRLIEMYKKLS